MKSIVAVLALAVAGAAINASYAKQTHTRDARAPASTQARELDWPVYGGDQGGTKFSPLTDINRETVARLAPAWEWATHEKAMAEFGTRPGAFEVTPLMIDNV